MKLLLIDAYALIYRSYFAFIRAPRINSKKMNTSAIFGFVNTLNDAISKIEPTHLAIVFDPSGPTFRHEKYPAYKAQREETPDDIRIAVPYIKKLAKAYNIKTVEVPRYEADDVIGTVAKQAQKSNYEVIMLTPDKDYVQLIEEHIQIMKPKTGGGYEFIDTKAVEKKYEFKDPKQMIDFLALTGDSADNIPGCPGVGPKTASKLLKEYYNIEEIYTHINEIKGSLKEKLETNKEQVEFSKYLVTINCEVPISFEPSEYKRQKGDTENIIELYTELEFKTLLKKLLEENSSETTPKIAIQGDLFAQPETAKTEIQQTLFNEDLKSLDNTNYNYTIAESVEEIQTLAKKLSTLSKFAFDTETDSLSPLDTQIVGFSCSWEAGSGIYIPFSENFEETKEKLSLLKPILEDPEIKKIGQNIKFDVLVLRKYDIYVRGIYFDTMIAHYLINPELRHGMDYMAETYLNYHTKPIEDLIGPKGKKQRSMRTVPVEDVAIYAAEDADITWRLYEKFEPILKEQKLDSIFYKMEIPLVTVLADMEETGVKLDVEALNEYAQKLETKLESMEQSIYSLAGQKFNINSPQQVGEILFDQLKLEEKPKKTKTGNYSTSEDILIKLKSRHPIVSEILNFRGTKKLLSTYILSLPLLIKPQTGKLHTSFNQTITATGRLSSSDPNLQNIPIRDEEGKEIRKAFIADDEDSVFFSADYSQIELRIMAHLSNDKQMIDAFNHNLDIHTSTAAKIYKLPLEKVSSNMRRNAKTANFGIIYGISPFGLSQRLDIPRSEAKMLIDGYFETYPQVKEYMDQSIEFAKEKGYVETLFGRRRYLPDIKEGNAIVRGFAERNAINAPIQGTAADIIKLAMVNIHRRFQEENLKSKMIMQIHDELNFSVKKEELETVKQIVNQEMENVIKLQVPLIADCGVGNNWLEAH